MQPFHDCLSRSSIRRQRHIMHIADPHKRRNIWLVGLRSQWVAEEDDRLDITLGNTSTNNEVAAFGAMNNLLNGQGEFLLQESPRVPCGNKLLASEEVEMGSYKLD